MTYREKIQEMVSRIDSIYDDAGWMRDIATGEEKECWNKIRGAFYSAALPLRKLDDSLSDGRAEMKIN